METMASGSPDGTPSTGRPWRTGATPAPSFSDGVSITPWYPPFAERSLAEVRIDGVRHDACSDALLELPWPKEGNNVARFFVLFIHAKGHAPEP